MAQVNIKLTLDTSELRKALAEEKRRVEIAQLSVLVRQYPEHAKKFVEKYLTAIV